MSIQFCTSCGHSAIMDAKFCENCGAVFDTAGKLSAGTSLDMSPSSKSSTTTTSEAVVKHASMVLSTWVMPFNATLIFGSTLVAVLDFLSPRVALLPIAATVAVVGLLSALALRKFVAPSLPQGSGFRRALAPELGVHKSPLLIATGLLSALMVSGAAWSSATSTSGGVLASNFDAARNAQMQLGVMQGLQKEQRVQTAVLEDIREGRSIDPKKELNNLGADWETSFQQALANGDVRIVNLFLAAKKEWNVSDAFLVMSLNRLEMLDLLLKNVDLLRRVEGDCIDIIERRIVNRIPNMIYNKREYVSEWTYRKFTDLTEGQKNFLDVFCLSESYKASLAVQYKYFLKDRAALKKLFGNDGGPAIDDSDRQLKLYQQLTSKVNKFVK